MLASEQENLTPEQEILASEQQILAPEQENLAWKQQILAAEQEVTCFGARGDLLQSKWSLAPKLFV
jgi:hypothetical protein